MRVVARVVLLAHNVFLAHHLDEHDDFGKERHRLRRSRQSWLKQLEQRTMLCTKRFRGRCDWLLKDEEMLWQQGSYGVCSHRGELFRQQILSLMETAKRLGCCPQEWLRAVVQVCIEKTNYLIPVGLCASSPSWGTVTP